jgi:hypothetical protein
MVVFGGSGGIVVYGSGWIIGTPLQIAFYHGVGFTAPSKCPRGFISIPGNIEFYQPGFCVAKYKMSYVDGVVPDST